MCSQQYLGPVVCENKKNIKGSGTFDPYLFKKSVNVYYGEWKKGQPHGYGKLYNPDKDFYYEGYFQDGLPSYYGVFLSNDVQYRGSIKLGRAKGEGMYREGKKTIEGYFEQSLPKRCVERSHNYTFQGQYNRYGQWGKGKLIFNSQTCTYEGQFQNREPHGFGILQTPYYIYQGNFKQGKKSGEGKIEWKEGYIYEGQFLNDQITGKGVLLEKQEYEKIIYRGQFVNGAAQGEGVVNVGSGRVKTISARFKDGKAEQLI